MHEMAPVLLSRTLDGGAPNTDAAGIVFVVTAIIYTMVLVVELTLLYNRRSAFCIRIRGLEIVFASVSMLHVYLVLVLLVYPLNGQWPCSAEFWVMSIFLPSGMAVFQGASSEIDNSIQLIFDSLQCESPQSVRESASNETRLSCRCA